MNVSAQRVADVFAYLGDASASGPDEIGVAMQKASASAEEFGLTFEWLGAYIATISEKTRQAPEVIGTSLNSIMARLHSVKAKGFNDEDETKINDVAKALNTIDVALLDNEGNWRAMSDIFSDIAVKWDELDDKQRAYIATTMAGTRQQNYFLALMSDMALGLEGGSRAYELYYGALGAAGTATEKYAIWQESVTASQNRLNAALESFYALLNAEWMKGFYEGMAGLVEIITAGTDALGGWNLLIPAIAVGVTGLIAVVYKAVVAFKAMQAAIAAGNGMATLMSGGTIGAILAAVAALATVVTMIVGASQSASEVEEIDYGSTIQSVSTYRDSIDGLVSELETLASKTSLTAEEQARADQIMETLSGTSLSMKTALEGGADGFDTLGQKAAAARGEVEKTEQALRNLNAAGALQNLRDTDNAYGGAIGSAQAELQSAGSYGTIAELYAQYIAENPTGLYRQGYAGGHGTYVTKDENFYTYAVQKSKQEKPIWLSREEKERIQADRDLWAGIVKELDKLGIDAGSSVDEVKNKMLEFDIAMGSIVGAAEQELAEAWQPVFDDLYTVMMDGTSFSQLPQYLQQTAIDYYDAYIGAVDQQKALAEGELMVMASDLTNYVNQLFAFMSTNPEFTQLMAQFDELYAAPRTNENVAALNALLPAINGYIEAYNALTADTSDDIPLLTDFIPADEAEQAAHSMSLLSEGLESYFAQMKEKRDAAEAEENLYADQVA
ncbi:MAG: phage tail tape measure protein [Oscillospiraceae bacterium]|nr:phage tail tape measure protein [Clostridia bacterium]MBQ9167935.1 phage tail tape measure protein [Oscillospiraceae bacterium]